MYFHIIFPYKILKYTRRVQNICIRIITIMRIHNIIKTASGVFSPSTYPRRPFCYINLLTSILHQREGLSGNDRPYKSAVWDPSRWPFYFSRPFDPFCSASGNPSAKSLLPVIHPRVRLAAYCTTGRPMPAVASEPDLSYHAPYDHLDVIFREALIAFFWSSNVELSVFASWKTHTAAFRPETRINTGFLGRQNQSGRREWYYWTF